jgi:cell wall assembly regulator SMI1
MRVLWDRLERAASDAGIALRLRPGASEGAVRAAERTMGLSFPEALRASLLVHDGQEPDTEGSGRFAWLPGHEPLARLDAIVEQWTQESALFKANYANTPPEDIEGGRLFHFLWHPKRIPLAGNPWWDQDNTYVDCVPGPNGVYGQLAVFGKGCFGQVHGPGLRATLEILVSALDTGEWLFRDGDCVSHAKKNSGWAKYVDKKLAKKRVP